MGGQRGPEGSGGLEGQEGQDEIIVVTLITAGKLASACKFLS